MTKLFLLQEDDPESSTWISIHETREGAMEAASAYVKKDNDHVYQMNQTMPEEFEPWRPSMSDPDILYERYGWNFLYITETELEP